MVEFHYLCCEDVIRYILVLLYLCIINYESVLGICYRYIYTFITLRQKEEQTNENKKAKDACSYFTFSIIPWVFLLTPRFAFNMTFFFSFLLVCSLCTFCICLCLLMKNVLNDIVLLLPFANVYIVASTVFYCHSCQWYIIPSAFYSNCYYYYY